MKDDDRIAIVFIGEGGAQNGRMAECLNAAAKENLPLLFLVIDNGRAINTFTPDVAQNMDIFAQGEHYGVPGIKVDGGSLEETLKAGRAVIDHVRTKGPAIMQVRAHAEPHLHDPVPQRRAAQHPPPDGTPPDLC